MKVAVLIPQKITLLPKLRERCAHLLSRLPAANPTHDLTIIMDASVSSDHPRAWARTADKRNRMLGNLCLNRFDWVCWIDADVVDYPPDIVTDLIDAAGDGIAAPLVLVEDMDTRFYDVCAFTENGLRFSHDSPYWPLSQPAHRVEPVDSVGTFYVANAGIYRDGARYMDHPRFTEHFSVCQAARAAGRRIVVDRDLIVRHANLPKWGEAWH